MKQQLAPHEFTFFSEYDQMLSKYFRSTGLDLTTDIPPPPQFEYSNNSKERCNIC